MSDTKDENFEQFYASATQSQIKALAHAAWLDGNKAQETAVEKKVLALKGGEFYAHVRGYVTQADSSDDYRNAGAERATRDLAVKAAIKRLERDRLAAWVVEHSGEEYEFSPGAKNAYIYQSQGGVFQVGRDSELPDLGKIYMPVETAEWICEKLNAGEIIL